MKKDSMKKAMKTATASICACALAFGLAGCSGAQNGGTSGDSTDVQPSSEAAGIDGLDLEFSKRDLDPSYDAASAVKVNLNGSGASIEGEGVSAQDGTVTFTTAGTYIVSGELTSGQLVVDAGDEDKLQIVLDGATVTNYTGPALYINNADKCFLTLAEGTQNSLTDGEDYELTGDDDNRDGAVFSRDDLTINGTGALSVFGNYQHGVVGKDDLVITGGNITVNSAEDAFQANDAIKIADGNITVNAGDDAFHSEGFFYVRDGNIDVQSCYEGYEAEQVIIDGGDHSIVASDDAINAALSESDSQTSDVQTSAGDAPEREGNVQERGGFPAKPGDNGEGDISSSSNAKRPQGQRPMGEQPTDGAPAGEPPTGEPPADGTQPDGSQGVPAPQNDGRPMDANAQRGGQDMAQSSSSCIIQINGGTVYVVGAGDGIDSNGNVEINGGVVLAAGPSAKMDGVLDYDLNAKINGGTVLMLGDVASTRGMNESAQAWALSQVSGMQGQEVSLLGADGTVLASMDAPVNFSNVLASSSEIGSGQPYAIQVGDNVENLTME